MQRPTSVTVFAVLNIVFGVLGVLGLAFQLVQLVMPMSTSKNPVAQVMESSPGFALYTKAMMPVALAVTVALIASGIGMFSLLPWARKVAIGYGVYALVGTIASAIINYLCLFQPLLDYAHQHSGQDALSATITAYGMVVCTPVGLIYPVLLLIFMFRPKVVAAFQGAGAEPLPAEEFDPR